MLLYSGGFFLIRSANVPSHLDGNLLRDRLVSLSAHICPRLSVHWGWPTGDLKDALAFGVPQANAEAFRDWCCLEEPLSGIAFPSMFHTIEKAGQIAQDFLPDQTHLHLIEAALPQTDINIDWYAHDEAYYNNPHGVVKRIQQHIPPLSGGSVLGFEVVSYDYDNLNCSWLCSGLDQDLYSLFGVRPNPYGLMDRYEDAEKLLAWMNEDPDTRGEPEPYGLWMLVAHPLK